LEPFSLYSQILLKNEKCCNYNAMYRQDTTPLVNAATPGGNEGFGNMGPVAANEAFGGFGGTPF
jgi:hypothetical protein